MFCKKCGTEINEDAKFCPKCGANVESGEQISSEEKIQDNEVKFQLKPTFKIGYKLLTNFGRSILYVIIFSIYFLSEIEDADNIGKVVSYIIGPVIGIILIYIIIKMIIEKIQYNHYEYNFYNTKVEYVDGFLNKEEKELKYKHIREVALKQNVIQRLFGIGTIRIFTNATSGYNRNNRNMNGLQIHCVENPQEQYKKVKELIDGVISED